MWPNRCSRDHSANAAEKEFLIPKGWFGNQAVYFDTFIKALKGVTYVEVLSVMDVAKGAGVEVLGAMLPTAEEWAQARPGGF